MPYKRILAVDDIGDIFHEPPHLLVDYLQNASPLKIIRIVQDEDRHEQAAKFEKLKKVDYFPDEMTSDYDNK